MDAERNEEVVSLKDAKNRYLGEWFRMRVTEFDERGRPKAGVVLSHDKHLRRVEAMFPEGPDYDPDRGPRYGIFFGRRTPDPEREAENDAAFAQGEEISVFDASHKYAGEWILMRVTKHAKDHLDTVGVVLKHARSRSVIRPFEWAEYDRADRTGQRCDVLFGHEYLPRDFDYSTLSDLILQRELNRARSRK